MPMCMDIIKKTIRKESQSEADKYEKSTLRDREDTGGGRNRDWKGKSANK